MSKFSLKQLKAAAGEMNDVFGLDPEIDVKIKDPDELEALVREAATLATDDDEFSDETREIITALLEPEKEEKPAKKQPAAAASKKAPAKVEEEEEEDPEEEAPKKSAKAPVKAPAKAPVKEEKKPAAKAKEKAPDVKKATTKPKEPKVSTSSLLMDFLAPLIKKGKFTKKQLIEKAQDEFPETKNSTIVTILTDCKNPKYNKFPELVVADENGLMSFKK